LQRKDGNLTAKGTRLAGGALMSRRSRRVVTALALVYLAAGTATSAQEAAPPHVPQVVRDRAEREGSVPVLVQLRLANGFRPEASLSSASAARRQREEVAGRANRVLSSLPNGSYRLRHRFATVPYVAIELTRSAIAALDASADVARVLEDTIVQPVLAESVPLIQADQAWASGDDGTGTTIAILDTGVDGTHPMLAGKVVEEACYSSTVAGTSVTLCPNGLEEQVGSGAAVPCTLSECIHGTHVAGIAAGNGDQAGQSFSGVAKGAQLMAVQVFSKITSPLSCGFVAPCAGAFTSDVVAGLERVYTVAATRRIAAVNMSLGGGSFEGACDDQPYKPIIDNLRAIGIATVVASGNDGSTAALASPACVSSAISVGSTDKNDAVSYFSNVSTSLSLFAPGGQILSSVPGGG
jgi:subtilisin family serine protease